MVSICSSAFISHAFTLPVAPVSLAVRPITLPLAGFPGFPVHTDDRGFGTHGEGENASKLGGGILNVIRVKTMLNNSAKLCKLDFYYLFIFYLII